jgi:predicted ATPase
LACQTALGTALMVTRGYAAPEVELTYSRAQEICQKGGDAPQLFSALWGVWYFYAWDADLYRVKGEFMLLQGAEEPDVEACFHTALEIAQRQGAKSYELRAAMSLARLWQCQGKRAAARQRLSEVYGWFTEGFDTADLQEAKALLEALG